MVRARDFPLLLILIHLKPVCEALILFMFEEICLCSNNFFAEIVPVSSAYISPPASSCSLIFNVALDLRFIKFYRICIRSENKIVTYSIANINAFAYRSIMGQNVKHIMST